MGAKAHPLKSTTIFLAEQASPWGTEPKNDCLSFEDEDGDNKKNLNFIYFSLKVEGS